MEEQLNKVKVRALFFFVFEENQNFVFCGQRSQTQGWDSSPALNVSPMWREPYTLKQLTQGQPQGQKSPQCLLTWPIRCHGPALTKPVGFSKVLPCGDHNEPMINFPFSCRESLGGGFEAGMEGLAISESCLSSCGFTFKKDELCAISRGELVPVRQYQAELASYTLPGLLAKATHLIKVSLTLSICLHARPSTLHPSPLFPQYFIFISTVILIRTYIHHAFLHLFLKCPIYPKDGKHPGTGWGFA